MSALTKLTNVKKLVVFIVSQVLLAVNEGFVPAQYVHYVQLTVFFLTAIGVYAARNAPAADPTSAEEDVIHAGLDLLLPGKHEDTATVPALPPVPAVPAG